MVDQDSPHRLEYATPLPHRRRWLPIVLVAGSVAVVVVLLFSILAPSPLRGRQTTPRARCLSNMHQIGLAILLYQNDHGQSYPNSLPELMEEEITPAVFVCPESHDTPSAAATTQAIAADFAKPGHLSYIYLGKGLNDKTATADTVVLYEPLANHGNTGMNVLFGDGHADWEPAAVGAKIVTAAATGHLPIRLNDKTGAVTTSP